VESGELMACVGDVDEPLSLSLLVCTHFDDVISYVGRLTTYIAFVGVQRLTKYSSRKTCESNFNRINSQSIGPARLHNPKLTIGGAVPTIPVTKHCAVILNATAYKIPQLTSLLPGRSYFRPTTQSHIYAHAYTTCAFVYMTLWNPVRKSY